MRSTIHLPAALLVLPLTALYASAWAAPQATAGSATQGLTVVRDAESGELRAPTSAERQALHAATPAGAARPSQPTVVTGSDGRLNARLGESRLVYSVVTRGPDGKLDQTCVQGADAAERAVDGNVSAAIKGAAPVTVHQKGRHDHR